ncbi:MAG: hypothetical protein ACXIUV_04120 [Alkalilacustris sp.]
MSQVVGLVHEEGVRLDGARLVGLVSRMGDGGAERHLSHALDRMERATARIEALYGDGDMAAIRREAASLAKLATEVGMTSLARVADDVQTCAARGDTVAFAATSARLRRIAARSLGAMDILRGSAV